MCSPHSAHAWSSIKGSRASSRFWWKSKARKAPSKNEEASGPTPRTCLSAVHRYHRVERLPETLRAAESERGPSRTQAGCNNGCPLTGSNALTVAEKSQDEPSRKKSTKPFWNRSGEMARNSSRCSLKTMPLLCSLACLRDNSCDTSGFSPLCGKKGIYA